MHRFYIIPEDINNGTALIKNEEFRHLSKVLRLNTGDKIGMFDGIGWEYEGTITRIREREALIHLEKSNLSSTESPLQLWLAQGLPKGDKMEHIIQKTTELGIRGIIPLELERSVVRLEGKKKTERAKRWQKIAIEAAKQCRRAFIPPVHAIQTLQVFLEGLPEDKVLLVPWEEGGTPLKQILQAKEKYLNMLKPVYVLIGPEGGLDKKEVEKAQEYGGVPVSLGPRIMRTETAGLVTAAVVMYHWGDLG